jgi:Zn-dependent protease with chaperone function
MNENDIQSTLHWESSTLQVMERPTHGRPAVIGCKNAPGARLIIEKESDYLAILPLVQQKNIKHSGVIHSWRRVWLLVLATILLLTGLLWGIPLAAPIIAKIIPHSWDNALGQYVIGEMVPDAEECVYPAGQKALEIMISKLSKNTPIENNVDVKVIQSGEKDINAFAVPGNYIVILSGLLSYADNPDEVAGVLAHEMGHVIKHHPSEGILRKMGIHLILTGAFGSSADYASELIHLKYTRENEQQADDMAVSLLKQAKVNVKHFERFFEKIASEGNIIEDNMEIFQYFSDHPGLLERIQHIQKNATLMKTEPILTHQEWQDLKNICKKTAPLEFKDEKEKP